jgi:hypothetical protein
VLEASDTTVTQSRAAMVGIHAKANDFITEDGYKLIEAAIQWVLPPQKLKCAFFSQKGWNPLDSLLVEKLKEDYDVSILNPRSIYDESMSIDTLYHFDFTFISESVSSWPWEYGDGPKIRSIPIPMVMTEGYIAKPEVLGWTTANVDTGYGAIFQDSSQLGVAHKVLITDNTGHELSAGFGLGTEVELVTNSYAEDVLTFCVPEIDYIPIAVSSLEPGKTVVLGVEKGTTVWNKAGTVLEASDTTVTQSRAAMVGIHAKANDFITEDGYKLITAGIQWILKDPVNAIETVATTVPDNYMLNQNYPNPFNPTTEISFVLAKAGHTTLTIYNVLGQKVANLLDINMKQGTHKVTFDARGLASGVYFYHIRSNNFSQIKKMILMR